VTKKAEKKREALLKKIQKVIDYVVGAQLYDVMMDTEWEDLENEAWIAVLEAVKDAKHLTMGLVHVTAKRAIVHYKMWRRCALTVPKESAHLAIEYAGGLKNLVGLPPTFFGEEASDDEEDEVRKRIRLNGPDVGTFIGAVGRLGSEKDADIRLVMEKVRKELDDVENIVLDMLLMGELRADIWRRLEALKVPCAKWYSYNDIERIREVFRKYLKEVEA